MNFNKKIKEIDKKIKKEKLIKIKDIHAQYNPNRFKYWKTLFEDDKEILNMKNSPHFKFLKYITNNNLNEFCFEMKHTEYYQMHKKYGKSQRWIIQKIDRFIKLFEDIKNNGFDNNNRIIILNKPLIENKHNINGYEIFEGHHRVACLLFLEYNEILCDVVCL